MAVTVGEVAGIIKSDLSWLQRHERLVLAVIAGLALWFSIGKIDTLIINHDHANLEQAKVVAAVQEEKNQALAAQVAQQAAQYKELADKVQQQNAQLEQANIQLAQALTQRQKTDATLPPTDLATRWRELLPSLPASDPSPTVDLDKGTLHVTQAAAVATVQALEQVPVLAKQLDNEIAEVTQDQKLIDAGVVQVRTLNLQVDGLKLQLVDNAKVCSAQVATVKAEARKSKRHWFYAGVVVGLSIRGGIKLLTGL